ncbi:O-antigen ligase family protein [Bradyrhizobium paxllaeri]|uniref:O-antigen ligase family protein n=1 Tax=Bradyrhizobium paxllaeri TaxID=190148 RepID=UPI0008106498|nr:O-antigen ligase family protein [Bradyrhizobium paxllaeri]
MFVNALFLFLMFRCSADILSPGEKGTTLVALYVGGALALTAIKIATFGTTRGDMAIGLAVCWLAIVNLLWIPAEATSQLYFSVTVLLPIIFLLFLSRCEPSIFVDLRKRTLRFGIPVLCGLLLIFVFSEGEPEADLLTKFGGNAGTGEGEKSFHVVAQTIAKFSILLINQWIGLSVIALVLLTVLNVRSALLGFLLAFLIKKYSTFNLRVFLVTLGVSVVAIAVLLSNSEFVDGFLQRILYRDRVFFEQDTSNLMSGRDEIWRYYVQMLENSSLLELLFGRGAVWQYGSFPFLAHNDLLNLMICYGLVGTTAVLYAWYVILSRLEAEYRMPCVALFLVLFFTNGVVFHQSNLLFVLFMAGKAQQKELSESLVDEMIKPRGLPARG